MTDPEPLDRDWLRFTIDQNADERDPPPLLLLAAGALALTLLTMVAWLAWAVIHG
jgi:hypothetical protein